ncbi:hypothetical protein [Planomonospora sp. ID82291]|uniref:hypothetical protein n=1 Tax=Planomonospora sp. ID82291 TaxID=2738136 RepID=UPI0018C4481C|nr:hypothetical protein [Planomonospora sp. ID82291]MBG0818418.1 hypothetical protein [Planomonospora sp. ID82291]
MITVDDQLIAILAERTGLTRDALFMPVTGTRIQGAFSYPLHDDEIEDVVRRIVEDLTRVIPLGSATEADPASRYVSLHEMTPYYASAQTRLVILRISSAGEMPARRSPGDVYDPLTDGWDLDPEDYDDELVRAAQQWTWWKHVKAAGAREIWQMPEPYVGADSDVPLDRALDERDRTGDEAAYRTALQQICNANYRDIDAWAHSGHEALARANAVTGTSPTAKRRRSAALKEALGYYQTGVAVGELSLPTCFTGVLPWSLIQNRPFLRARHGLALALWRLGDFDNASTVLRTSLWINPADNQGLRDLLSPVEAHTPYEKASID